LHRIKASIHGQEATWCFAMLHALHHHRHHD